MGFSIGSCSQAWRPPPPSLRWGTSQVLLQTRCDSRASPVRILARSASVVQCCPSERGSFSCFRETCASGLVVLVTFSYGFLACLMFLFSAYLTVNPIVLVQSSHRAGVFFSECENRRVSGPVPWEVVCDGAERRLLGPWKSPWSQLRVQGGVPRKQQLLPRGQLRNFEGSKTCFEFRQFISPLV